MRFYRHTYLKLKMNLKGDVDVDVIALYEKYLGTPKKSGKVWCFPCFRCDQGKNTRHLYVNADGQYYCQKCGGHPDGRGKGNAFTFARLMGEATKNFNPVVQEKEPDLYDIKTAVRVYNYIFEVGVLTKEHRVALVESRGITHPDRFKVISTDGLPDVLKDRFTTDELISTGLFYKSKYENSCTARRVLSKNRILIPYFTGRDVTFIRSRGMGGDQTGYMGPTGASSTKSIWGRINPERKTDLIVTEGEFKAMAAQEHGFNCVSLPGMNNSHAYFVECCTNAGILEVTICFDTQIEDMKYVDGAAASLASKLKTAGIKAFRAELPLCPEIDDGKKTDIDAFLKYYSSEHLLDILMEAKEL